MLPREALGVQAQSACRRGCRGGQPGLGAPGLRPPNAARRGLHPALGGHYPSCGDVRLPRKILKTARKEMRDEQARPVGVRPLIGASAKANAMTIARRRILQIAAAGLAALPRLANAQSYPSSPVRIIVATSAGGTTDIVARLIA